MPPIKDVDLAEFDSYEVASGGGAPRPVRTHKGSLSKSHRFLNGVKKAQEKLDRIKPTHVRSSEVRAAEQEEIEMLRIERRFKYQPDRGY